MATGGTTSHGSRPPRICTALVCRHQSGCCEQQPDSSVRSFRGPQSGAGSGFAGEYFGLADGEQAVPFLAADGLPRLEEAVAEIRTANNGVAFVTWTRRIAVTPILFEPLGPPPVDIEALIDGVERGLPTPSRRVSPTNCVDLMPGDEGSTRLVRCFPQDA